MIYVTERALYYYFLMQEIGEVGVNFWKFVAGLFGVKPKVIKAFEKVLLNAVLAELSTIGDVEMNKNFLNCFSCAEDEFGKSKFEHEAIEAKALALHKSCSLFGDDYLKGGRLRVLSHVYEKDHFASVLYALQVLYIHDTDECEKFAESILKKDLEVEAHSSNCGLYTIFRPLLKILFHFVSKSLTSGASHTRFCVCGFTLFVKLINAARASLRRFVENIKCFHKS